MNGYTGEVKDIIKDIHGNIIEEREWSSNTICDGLGMLVACLLKQQYGYSTLLYWAVGSGDNWDPNNPPLPSKSDKRLVNEIGRKVISPGNIKFVDDNGDDSNIITNTILISQTFLSGECNGNWMEMSIVSGNATNEINTGLFINHKTHKLVEKDSNKMIERQIRFKFRQEV